MATLEDVARHAGVSLATASRVLNGSTRQVGASLRTKVELAAAQLGYRTNVAAQTLAKGASNVIGLVVHDLTDPYFAALADGAMRVAESQALMVMVGTTHRDAEREIAFVSTLNAQRVCAVLLAGSRIADPHVTRRLREELDRYRDAGGRVACVGQDLLGVNTVVPSNHEGAAALARALAGLGHRRFAVLAGPPAADHGPGQGGGVRRGPRRARPARAAGRARLLRPGRRLRGGVPGVRRHLRVRGQRRDGGGRAGGLQGPGDQGARRRLGGGVRRHRHAAGPGSGAVHRTAAAGVHGRPRAGAGPGGGQGDPGGGRGRARSSCGRARAS